MLFLKKKPSPSQHYSHLLLTKCSSKARKEMVTVCTSTWPMVWSSRRWSSRSSSSPSTHAKQSECSQIQWLHEGHTCRWDWSCGRHCTRIHPDNAARSFCPMCPGLCRKWWTSWSSGWSNCLLDGQKKMKWGQGCKQILLLRFIHFFPSWEFYTQLNISIVRSFHTKNMHFSVSCTCQLVMNVSSQTKGNQRLHSVLILPPGLLLSRDTYKIQLCVQDEKKNPFYS